MSNFRRWVGNEDIVETPDTQIEAGMIPQTDLDIEEATTAVDAVDVELTQTSADCDDACGAVDELTGYHAIVEDASENGQGLEPETAKALDVAIESAIARLNLKIEDGHIMAGLEHFSTKRRLKATQVSAESIGESIKAGIKAVVDFIKRMWDHVVAFITGIFDKASGLEKKLKLMEDRVNKLHDGAFDDGKNTFKNRRIAISFGLIGNDYNILKPAKELSVTFDPAKIYNHHKRLGAMAESIIGSGQNFMDAVAKQTENKEKVADLAEYFVTLGQVFHASGCPSRVERNQHGESLVAMWDLADLSGFFIYSVGSINVTIGSSRATDWIGRPKINVDEEIPVLQKSEMKWHISEARKVLADTKKLQSLKTTAKKVSAEMTKMVEGFSDEDGDYDFKPIYLRKIKSITTIITSMATKIPKINLSVVEASLRYIDHSIAKLIGVEVKDVSGERGQVEPGMSLVPA